MPEVDHLCNVVYGEDVGHMPRENVPVDASSTIYSGRIAHLTAGIAIEGRTGPGEMLYVAHEGVDRSDVAGVQAIRSSLTGSVMGEGGSAVCSLIPIGPRLRIQTTEYEDMTYAEGNGVTCQTGSGLWRKATTTVAREVLGYVRAEPAIVDGLMMLDITVTGGPIGA